jgi:hypothetical protein
VSASAPSAAGRSAAGARPRPPRRRRPRCSPVGSSGPLSGRASPSGPPAGRAVGARPPRPEPLPPRPRCLPARGPGPTGGGAGRLSPIFGFGAGFAAGGAVGAASSMGGFTDGSWLSAGALVAPAGSSTLGGSAVAGPSGSPPGPASPRGWPPGPASSPTTVRRVERPRPPRDPRRRRRERPSSADPSVGRVPDSEGDCVSAGFWGDPGFEAPSELIPGAGAGPSETEPCSGAGSLSDRPCGVSDIDNVPSHDARSKACGASVAPGGRGSHRAPSRSIHW